MLLFHKIDKNKQINYIILNMYSMIHVEHLVSLLVMKYIYNDTFNECFYINWFYACVNVDDELL